jgi:molecular chaperone HscB
MPPTRPHCGAPLETPLACGACGRLIEVPAAEQGPFAWLGLEPGHELDTAALRKRLLGLTRLVHPDFFGQADAATRQQAEDASAALNGAWQVLSDEVRRADWLIASLGGPSESDEREMPQAFLMEVLEWNEALEEAREAPPDAPLPGALEALAGTWRSERARALDEVAGALTPLPERGAEALTRARRKLNAVRYLDRATPSSRMK